MKIPEDKRHVLFGGTFILANKLQLVADKWVRALSIKQWFLLRHLSEMPQDPPPTITMLARETDTSRQNVSKMLEVLERQGYVRLERSPEDRRSQSVVLTEAGAQVLRAVAVEGAPFLHQLFSGISGEECAAAADVMIKLIENLSRMQREM
ncbi:MAG TPA: MarR family transcriptional regulator [Papillibacter sp.]|jgi:DNA-binding MarR family transcriptional regulator|nr:MarR family transcriptional regulator [Papillibacter sp.]